MASTINASNTGFGGIVSTGDSSGQLQLQTAGTTALTIDTSQNVGIGTTSPGVKLDVNGSLRANDNVYTLNGAGYGWGNLNTYIGGSSSSNFINFTTNTSERMRIDSSGNVGIGTSSPSFYGSGLTVTNRIMPQATPSTNWGIDFATDTGGNNYITLAASATYDLATGGGLILISNNTVGDAALFLTYNGNTTKIAGGTTIVSGTGGASQIGVTWNSGASKYRINNGYGTSQSLWIGTIRIRQSN